MTIESADGLFQKKVFTVFFLSLLALFFLISYKPIFSNDIWLHLKAGEIITKNHFQLPDSDPFSYTTEGRSWTLHEWLSQLVFSHVYQFTGFTGLRLLRSFVEILTLALISWAAYRQTGHYSITLMILLTTAYLLRTRFFVRPEIFSHLFMALFYLIYFTLRKHKPWYLLPACLGFILWINVHSFMVMVIFILLIAVISRGFFVIQGVEGLFAKPWETRFKAAMLVVGVLSIFLTPYHLDLLNYVFSGSGVAKGYIIEWQPVFISLQRESYMALRGAVAYPLLLKVVVLGIIIIFAGSLALSLFWKGGPRWPLDETLIGLLMSGLALSAIRFVWLLFIPLLLSARYFAMALDVVDRRNTMPIVSKIPGLLFLSGGILFWINSGAKTIPANLHQTIQSDRYPTAITQILKVTHLDGRMFNPIGWGGYLIFHLYPHYKVFMDGRAVLHGPQLLQDHYTILHARRGCEELIDKTYQFDFMLLPKIHGILERCPAPTWMLIFENYNSSLYLRNNVRNRANLFRIKDYYRAQHVPFDPVKGFDMTRVIQENPGWASELNIED